MKYLHKFTTFINESFETEDRRKAEMPLTASQQTVVEKLVSALNDKRPNRFNEVELYADGTIIISYSANVTDWMNLAVYGESIRMWVDEVAVLRPIFLEIEGLDPEEISRMIDLNLIDNTSNYIELDGEYITGFNLSIELTYTSKDVQFEHTEGDSAAEYVTADYLDLNDSGPQEYSNTAEELMDTIVNWLDETAIRERDLQDLLDEEFPEDKNDDEDED
jgi:hypothetical protein